MISLTRLFSVAVVAAITAVAPLSAAASTVRFYLEETEASAFDVSGYFDIERSGSSLSVGEFSIETGAGEFRRLSSTFGSDGFEYTDDNGSRGFFLSSSLFFQNDTEFSVDGFTASNPIQLRLLGQNTGTVNSYLDTVLGGGSITTVIQLEECFNCSPFRQLGFATLTSIAPSSGGSGGGLGGEIPVPASAWLLLSGLGLLGAARSQKSRQ